MEIVRRLHAIATGSRKYGAPREDSDLDLVVFMEGADVRLLGAAADMTPDGFTVDGEPQYDSRLGWPFRFGKLNVLVCTEVAQWQAWQQGTESLHYRAKHDGETITREIAVETFKAIIADQASRQAESAA